MSEMTSFVIDQKVFVSDQAIGNNGSFEVTSALRPYVVSWDESLHPTEKINTLLAENPKNILLIDEKVYDLYGKFLEVDASRVIAVKATENYKTLEGVCQLFDFLYCAGFTKAERLIVVGGGIVQDVGGFVAASYKRGIKWSYFPTTLLSMCDSCIGGKASVNYKEAKNQMAIFSAPSEVIIHPAFLRTLTCADIQSGLGEILKLCAIGGEYYLNIYQKYVIKGKVNDFSDYKKLILMSLGIKRAVIEEDEFELHYRKSLNYGHTLGHAIEVMSDYCIPHGIAVTVGIMLANALSVRRGFLSEDDAYRINQLCLMLLDNNVVKIMSQLKVGQLLELLKNDKKVEGNQIKFIMLEKIGKVFFAKIKLDKQFEQEVKDVIGNIFLNQKAN